MFLKIFAVQTKHVYVITFILSMCSRTHFNIKVWEGGFPFCHFQKNHFWHRGVLMESGEEEDVSFVRFLETSGNDFDLENLESEPPEPSWCAVTSAGNG